MHELAGSRNTITCSINDQPALITAFDINRAAIVRGERAQLMFSHPQKAFLYLQFNVALSSVAFAYLQATLWSPSASRRVLATPSGLSTVVQFATSTARRLSSVSTSERNESKKRFLSLSFPRCPFPPTSFHAKPITRAQKVHCHV